MEFTKSSIVAIVMAGGLGKRMESDLPKVLHPVGGLPMIVRVVDTLVHVMRLGYPVCRILVVVGKYRDQITACLQQHCSPETFQSIRFVDQSPAMGTGHAIQCCMNELCKVPPTSKVLILSGDVPLIRCRTIVSILMDANGLCSTASTWHARFMTTHLENPRGYGRVLLDKETGQFVKIVEEKDCVTEEERETTLVNAGIYLFDLRALLSALPLLSNQNAQGEYYLTDVVGILRQCSMTVDTVEVPKEYQPDIMGVNTKAELEQMNDILSLEALDNASDSPNELN
jgi:bifunctional N-acetylglucosamine-1-phosphate-uridyltransferase/glucosamine-1-phosphate-acetyltransferase GlmU-like protein